MTKLAIFGPQGAGKTTIAMLFIRSFMHIDKDIKVYTNCLNVDNDPRFVTITDLSQLPFKDGKPKIVYVDEAYFTVGSRDSSSKQNKVWTRAFALFRKSDVILTIFSTHRPNMIDVNIRDLLDYIIMARKTNSHNDYLLYETISKLAVPITVPKSKELFNFTRFNTKDFPPPITATGLEHQDIFKILK